MAQPGKPNFPDVFTSASVQSPFLSTGWVFLCALIFWFGLSSVSAQTDLTWENLADVRFETVIWPQTGQPYQKPSFSKRLEQLDGKEIRIIGYLLPLDVYGKAYALSENPFAACYFCGKSGPESVMELDFETTEKWFAMDRLVMVQGRLELNAEDPNRLYYRLVAARAIERLDH